jgi:hypothetical protein
MAQPKIHASAAARQAAFRLRREQSRQADLAAKGLPALPSIPSMPGWPRWNAAFASAQELIAATLSEMQDYFEARSEGWQEGERGEEHQEKIASAEAVLEVLSDLTS